METTELLMSPHNMFSWKNKKTIIWIHTLNIWSKEEACLKWQEEVQYWTTIYIEWTLLSQLFGPVYFQ